MAASGGRRTVAADAKEVSGGQERLDRGWLEPSCVSGALMRSGHIRIALSGSWLRVTAATRCPRERSVASDAQPAWRTSDE